MIGGTVIGFLLSGKLFKWENDIVVQSIDDKDRKENELFYTDEELNKSLPEDLHDILCCCIDFCKSLWCY